MSSDQRSSRWRAAREEGLTIPGRHYALCRRACHREACLCFIFLVLSTMGPILFDWVRS